MWTLTFLQWFYHSEKPLVKNLVKSTHSWMRLQNQPLYSSFTHSEIFGKNSTKSSKGRWYIAKHHSWDMGFVREDVCQYKPVLGGY